MPASLILSMASVACLTSFLVHSSALSFSASPRYHCHPGVS